LQSGLIHELDFLQAVAKWSSGSPEPLLPILRDHFAQRGPHGVHYCFLTSPLRSHVHAFRASAPTGKLAVHIVKPIIACVLKSLKGLHSLNIIHAGRCIIFIPNTSFIHICIDIKADNVLFLGPNTAEIEETIAKEPLLTDGSFEFKRVQYPILRSQPFKPRISWDSSPFVAETIQVVLSDLGAGMQTPVFSILWRWN
jgi:serine/threonine-protein kinase SRPK3